MNFICKHKIFTFYSATIFLTGVLFFAQMAFLPNLVIGLYLLSPAITALLLITITSKQQGVINFLRGLIPANTKFVWLALSVILPVTINLGCAVVFHLYNGTELNVSVTPLGIGFIIAIVIGCIGEELGWRCHLLPLLVSKYDNKVVASIILGILWGLWHIGDYGEGIGFLFFVFSTIGISIIMTWLYYQGKENFLTALLFHTFYNLSGIILAIVPENGVVNIQFRIINAVILCGVAFIIILISPVFGRKKRDTVDKKRALHDKPT